MLQKLPKPSADILDPKRPAAEDAIPLPKKKKLKRDKDLYFPRVRVEEEAPPFSMLSSCRTLDMESVEVEMNRAIDAMAEVMNADRDMTEFLLFQCYWRKIPLLKAYTNLAETNIIFETGLGPQGSTKPAPPNPPLDTKRVRSKLCHVCYNNRDPAEQIGLWCGHRCCRECWHSHIESQLQEDHITLAGCFMHECGASVTREFLNSISGPDGKAPKLVSSVCLSVLWLEPNSQSIVLLVYNGV